MTVCIGDVRAEDDGIKKRVRSLIALVKLELFGRVLEHGSEESLSRTTTRTIEYQDPFIPLPAIQLAVHIPTSGVGRLKLTFPSTRFPGQQTT